ncbi:MAG TPA: hypothetical protein VFK00_11225, partial [Rhodanobacteraceae bacterium]|nr:hypothetical protein [Rhodanobacteraceae bacterium]
SFGLLHAPNARTMAPAKADASTVRVNFMSLSPDGEPWIATEVAALLNSVPQNNASIQPFYEHITFSYRLPHWC